MPAVVIATLAWVGLLVAALAFYLIWVVLILRHIGNALGVVSSSVDAVAHKAQPLRPVLTAVNSDLAAIAAALEDLNDTLAPPHAGAAAS